jgi:hypothetical protein
MMKLRRITWWEKSRDLMLSWACVAYLTLARIIHEKWSLSVIVRMSDM